MNYIDMIDWVLARAKGCPEADAVEAMRNACIDFAEHTRALTERVTLTFTAAAAAYPVASAQVMPVDILDAWVAGEQILVTFLNDPVLLDLGPTDYAVTFDDPAVSLMLRPTASVGAPVTVELLAAVMPTPSSTSVADILWNRHHEALKCGALARLLAEGGVAWSNPDGAVFHGNRFEAAKTAAAGEYGRNRVNAARILRVKPA